MALNLKCCGIKKNETEERISCITIKKKGREQDRV